MNAIAFNPLWSEEIPTGNASPAGSIDLIRTGQFECVFEGEGSSSRTRQVSLQGPWRNVNTPDADTGIWETSSGYPSRSSLHGGLRDGDLLLSDRKVPVDDSQASLPGPGKWLSVVPPPDKWNLIRDFKERQCAERDFETPGGISLFCIHARVAGATDADGVLLVEKDGEVIHELKVSSRRFQPYIVSLDMPQGKHSIRLINSRVGEGIALSLNEVLAVHPFRVLLNTGKGTPAPDTYVLSFTQIEDNELAYFPPLEDWLTGTFPTRCISIGDEVRSGFYLSPASSLGIKNVLLNPGDTIEFGLGIPDPAQESTGNGFRFAIDIATEGKRNRIEEKKIDPIHNEGHRGWVNFRYEFPGDVPYTGTVWLTAIGMGKNVESTEKSSFPIAVGSPVLVRKEFRNSGRPSVILISVDTLRADHLGCYGYAKNTSPAIDQFAENGVRFETAESQSTWTLPSHASFLTGYYPSSLGVRTHRDAISNRIDNLAARLHKAGYRTAAFVDSMNLHPNFGFYRGFESYDYKGGGLWQIKNRAKNWILRHPGEPCFIFLHCFNTHLPYDPLDEFYSEFVTSKEGIPEAIVRRVSIQWVKEYNYLCDWPKDWPFRRTVDHLMALYDAEIRAVDKQFSMFLDLLKSEGVFDGTLMVLTSDHGEGFMEHGLLEHGNSLYEELTNVPLIMTFPKGEYASMTVKEPIELINIPATVLDYLKLPGAESTEGTSLMPLIRGEGEWTRKECFGEYVPVQSNGNSDFYRRLGSTKYITGREDLLFDLSRDPGERSNLASRYPHSVLSHKKSILEFKRERERILEENPSEEAELDEDAVNKLRAMGYLK